jgi:nucleotide-binding universal stress UspA family protein
VEAALHPVYREQAMASARAEAEAELAPVVERLCEGHVVARSQVVFGRAAEAIVEFAEKEGVDLIALSTHGRSGVSRWFFGSVAEKVLRATHLPLFLVRPPGLTGIPFPPQPEIEL